jgi:hypothetical protein
MRRAADLFVKHYLRNAAPVANVQKDKVAMVAPPVHPAHQNHVLSGLLGPEISTHMRSLQTA